MSISALVLTLNEEVNLEACLASLAGWTEKVVVLDSGSSDATVEIARRLGAVVVVREFDDYATQRNFGLGLLGDSSSWVLMLDADERVPAALREELIKVTSCAPESVSMLHMRRRDYLWGTWIRASSGYPTWFARVGRTGRFWVERPINEVYHTDGESAKLAAHIDHFPFAKGLAAWIEKHNRYSTMEAQLLFCRPPAIPWGAAFSRNPLDRRRAAKAMLYRMPLRPAVVFWGLFLFRGGMFEGRAGLTFCLLRAWYEFIIDCKVREFRRQAYRNEM